MFFSKKLVRKYQDEHKRKFNEDISKSDAERELFDLTTLIRLVVEERKYNHDR